MSSFELKRKLHGLTRSERALVQQHFNLNKDMKALNELIRQLRRKRGFNARMAA